MLMSKVPEHTCGWQSWSNCSSLLFLLLFSLLFGVAVLFFMIVDIVMLSDINLIVSYLNSFLDDLSHVYQDIFGTCEVLLFIPTLVCMWRVNISSSNVCWCFIHGLDCMNISLQDDYKAGIRVFCASGFIQARMPCIHCWYGPKNPYTIIIQVGLKLWPS